MYARLYAGFLFLVLAGCSAHWTVPAPHADSAPRAVNLPETEASHPPAPSETPPALLAIEAPLETLGGRIGGAAPNASDASAGARVDRESYQYLDENPFRRVATNPLSTFSIDVDTASYANVRRFLNGGMLPPPGAVRIEELVNYFRFSYPQPVDGQPFSVATELAPCPWNPKHLLALIGLQGREIADHALPPRNLVFLVDVSGSMMSSDKLPLVQNALRLLARSLTSRDRVAIVV